MAMCGIYVIISIRGSVLVKIPLFKDYTSSNIHTTVTVCITANAPISMAFYQKLMLNAQKEIFTL